MAITDVRVEAAYCERTGEGYVCGLCPRRCRIPYGKFGACGARKAEDDMLRAYTYGKVSSVCVDPVEKKPLYHYKPRSRCFSLGGVGCNMKCLHCQNYSISSLSYGKKRTTYESPGDIAAMCAHERLDTIAFTYNEPSIWFEYIRDVAAAAPEADIVIVTNGLICEEPLRELCGLADAFNIDVKGFTEDFYREVCNAELADVLHSAEVVHGTGTHLELTYLVIPGYNDTESEITGFSRWVRDSLDADVPVHFTRFHPDHLMTDVPWTPVETVLRCREIAMSEGLRYVYVGNAVTEEGGNTFCPGCGALAVRRTGYCVEPVNLDGSRCSVCGHGLNIVPSGRPMDSRGRGPGTARP